MPNPATVATSGEQRETSPLIRMEKTIVCFSKSTDPDPLIRLSSTKHNCRGVAEQMLPGLYAHMLNGFLLSLVFIVGIRRFACEFELVDIPDARKKHEGLVPLCGGIAVFSAFMISGIGFQQGLQIPWNWEIGLGMLVLLGVADDRWRLPAAPRLAIQTLAAIILLSTALPATLNLGRLDGIHAWHLPFAASAAMCVFFVVGMINAVNMMDGVDGLAGTSVAGALFWLALLAVHLGDASVTLHALVLLTAMLGFLIFNLRHPWQSKASVFLGDGGSLMLGAALAYFIIDLSRGTAAPAFPVLLWIVILPVIDTLSLIVRRLANRRSPMSPDRWHLHHLLLDAGISPARTTMVIAGASTACGAIGYLGAVLNAPDTLMITGLLLPILAHAIAVPALRDRIGESDWILDVATPAQAGQPLFDITAENQRFPLRVASDVLHPRQ